MVFEVNDISEIFWNAPVEDIKKGYVFNAPTGEYICLICGRSFEKGIVYPDNGVFYDAERAVRNHIDNEHISVFDYLLNMDKKLTGLTDLQRNLLSYFHNGYSDTDIVSEIDGGSTSTIRNHRFALRQREKQAKVFLAIMGLLEENKTQRKQKPVSIHKTATMVDERYDLTEEENEEIIKKYFKEGSDGRLSEFPVKEKRKIAILRHLLKRFEPMKMYTEKEVNEILKAAFDDYVTLRRYLIEYGFMDRHKDCSYYWVKI